MLPKETIKGIIYDYMNGLSLFEIIKKWQIGGAHVIYYYLKKFHIPRRLNKRICRKEEINGIVKDYLKGIDISEICKKWRIKRSQIFVYLKKKGYKPNRLGKFSEKTKEKLRISALRNWQNPQIREKMANWTEERKRKLSLSRGKYEIPNENTKELCYLIGVGLGDATLAIYPQKVKGKTFQKYQFSLETIHKEFAIKFKKNLEKVFSTKVKLWKRYQNTRIGNYKYKKVLFYRVATQKREIVLFLKKYLDNLDWIKTLPNEMKVEILRGLFDSEGGVGEGSGKLKDIRISYGQKEGNGLKIFKELLSDFSINYVEWKDKNNIIHLYFRKQDAAKLYFLLGHLTIKQKDNILKRWMVSGNLRKDVEKIKRLYSINSLQE